MPLYYSKAKISPKHQLQLICGTTVQIPRELCVIAYTAERPFASENFVFAAFQEVVKGRVYRRDTSGYIRLLNDLHRVHRLILRGDHCTGLFRQTGERKVPKKSLPNLRVLNLNYTKGNFLRLEMHPSQAIAESRVSLQYKVSAPSIDKCLDCEEDKSLLKQLLNLRNKRIFKIIRSSAFTAKELFPWESEAFLSDWDATFNRDDQIWDWMEAKLGRINCDRNGELIVVG